ncbi:MAG: tetratricopeptide repeat protein [Planctomycetota bacterium]
MTSIARAPLLAGVLLLGAGAGAVEARAAPSQGAAGASEDADDLAALRARARQWIGTGRAREALELLLPLYPKHPEESRLRLLAGEACFALGELETAVRHFEEGLRIRPGLRGQVFNLGRAYQRLDRHEEAEGVFEAMREAASPALRSKAAFGLGLTREAQGREVEAEALFREALALDPGSHRPRYRLALLALRRGDEEKALGDLRAVLRARPLHHGAAYNLALTLGRLGRSSESRAMTVRYRAILDGKKRIAALQERVRADPTDGPSMRALAAVHRELKSWPQALSWLQRALSLEPTSIPLALDLASTLRAAGQPRAAEGIYRDLLGRTPPVGEALGPLIELLEERGASVEARELRGRLGGGGPR